MTGGTCVFTSLRDMLRSERGHALESKEDEEHEVLEKSPQLLRDSHGYTIVGQENEDDGDQAGDSGRRAYPEDLLCGSSVGGTRVTYC